MNIKPVAGPLIQTPPNATVDSSAMKAAKARAISMISGNQNNQSQEHPVSNPSRVSAEDLSAISNRSSNRGQQGVVEEPTSQAPVQEAPRAASEESLSSHYATLARKEKALRAKSQQQETAIRAREARLAEQEAAIKAKEAEYTSNYIPKEKLTSDTLNALLDAGLSYDQITEAMLQQQSQPDFTKSRAYLEMQGELKAVKQAQELAKKSLEDQQTQAYQQAVNQIKTEAKKLVFTDPNFETIKTTNSVQDVVELIEETFKQDGVLLSVEEAAQLVEDHLVEEAMKIAGLKKIQQRLQASTPSAQKATDEPKQQQLKTLTNQVSSTRQLSAKERALLAFRGELK